MAKIVALVALWILTALPVLASEAAPAGAGAGNAAPAAVAAAPAKEAAPAAVAADPAKDAAIRFDRSATAGTLAERLQAVLGSIVLISLCWLLRERRPGQRFPLRIVAAGAAIQLVLAALILKTDVAARAFASINDAFVNLMSFSNEGARFLFGQAMEVPFGLVAFAVLPTIIFFSSLMTLGYHSGVMVRVVRFFSRYLARWMGISGAESLSTVGNIFLGQTEAPLLVRPFLGAATRSELHCIMVGGFGSVAGGVLAAYVGMLHGRFPDIAGHLLTASIMSAPCTVMVAKLMVPESEVPVTGPDHRIEVERLHRNAIDAAAAGASEGLALALNVGAMLLAFIALVALGNAILGSLLELIGLPGLTLQAILGYLFTPIAWLCGAGWEDAPAVGRLLGIKLVLNEFVAYLDLAKDLSGPTPLSPRATIISAYALCGFANFSSIAIQIGGISGMAPERRPVLAELGLRAMLGGTVVGYLTAALVAIVM